MSVRELGRRLGISASLVSRLVRKGMPRDSEEAARAWRSQYVQARRRDGVRPSRSKFVNVTNLSDAPAQTTVSHETADRETNVVEFEDPSVPEGLNASLERLRALERSIALTLRKLLKESRITEAAALRIQHASVLRSLFDSEAKALKLAERRGKLVTTEVAVKMISNAMSESIVLLRQLPSLARDASEKAKLETFLTAVLTAMREGAASAVPNGAAASVAQ